MSTFALVLLIIAIAVLFDFVNGFHDAANSIATVVATRVLNPTQAVTMAALFNFVAAMLFGTGVAATVGKGFVNTEIVTPYVLLAGLIGAVFWNILTWYFGIPISSSHALIGGYAGAAVAKAGVHGIILGKWPSTLAFIVVAPMIGMALGFVLMPKRQWESSQPPWSRAISSIRSQCRDGSSRSRRPRWDSVPSAAAGAW
jgi:PiT family inorganic phosphate transporter